MFEIKELRISIVGIEACKESRQNSSILDRERAVPGRLKAPPSHPSGAAMDPGRRIRTNRGPPWPAWGGVRGDRSPLGRPTAYKHTALNRQTRLGWKVIISLPHPRCRSFAVPPWAAVCGAAIGQIDAARSLRSTDLLSTQGIGQRPSCCQGPDARGYISSVR